MAEQKPLWEVATGAFLRGGFADLDGRIGAAAMFRAIAGEAIKAARQAGIDQEARNWFYQWLRSEADRAERVGGTDG